jgi:hypothetical protein
MSVPQSVADVLHEHVTLELECLDRLYLNGYIPQLQCEGGVVQFFRKHRGAPFASSALMGPISAAFVREIERFVHQHQIPVVEFAKGQRKDDVAQEHLRRFTREEGLLFVGKAQEKAAVYRTQKRRHPETGQPYPWIVRGTAMVNHYYFYGVDREFGPFFIKFCSYFPYAVKVCLNGHEWLKRQLTQEGIAFTPLDNGIGSCADPERMQARAQELSPVDIERFFHKWLAKLPQPFTRADQEASYVYQLSILQAECSLTQVLARPLAGRIFFEEVIRENLDLGRPDQVQLIFERRIMKRTPGRFRTRVLTEGVTPTLHVDYKKSRIKQYHKEGRALRTETTINDTRDFGIGKRLVNLPALRAIGCAAGCPLGVTAPGRRNDQSGLPDLRRRTPGHAAAGGGGRTTGVGAAADRSDGASAAASAAAVSVPGPRVHQRGVPRAVCGPAGAGPQHIDPGTDELSVAAAEVAWADHTDAWLSPLPGDGDRAAHRVVHDPRL